MDHEKQRQDSLIAETFAFNRRGFLKNMGIAALGTAATTLLPQNAGAGLLSPADDMAALKTNAADELYWAMVKQRFPLLRKLTYLNTGTEGSMSFPVLRHLRHDFKEFAEFPFEHTLINPHTGMSLSDVRKTAAKFIGNVGFDEVVMTTNTTEGLGFICNGMNWAAGDEILTHLHFMPYNAAALVLQERYGIQRVEVELPTPAATKQEIVDLFDAAITAKTKLMMFCNINFSTGLRMPVKELCELARSRGIPTLIDGAHAMGMIDLDMYDIDCDFYAGSCHKWLCGPPGTGFLYMKREAQSTVWPVVTDSYTKAGATVTSNEFQLRGQMCTPAMAGAMTAMEFQSAIGKEKIYGRIMDLNSYAKERLTDLYGEEKIFSPQAAELSTGLVSFNPFDSPYEETGGNISKLYQALFDKNIVTRSVDFYDKTSDPVAMRALRLSTHLYNNYRDIDRALDAIEESVKDIKAGNI